MFSNFFKIIATISLLSFVIYTCQEEDDALRSYETKVSDHSNEIQGKWERINPENPDNPFDSVGINYTAYLESLWEIDSLFTSVQSIITEVNFITAYPNSIALNNISSTTDLLSIQNTLDDPDEALQDVLDQSGLSSGAKNSLWNLINYTTLNESADYQVIYSYIVNFENSVILDLTFTGNEKRTILSFSSFIRHGLHLKKRRDDKDWDISVASKTAAIKGALLSPDAATYWALILGLSDNYL